MAQVVTGPEFDPYLSAEGMFCSIAFGRVECVEEDEDIKEIKRIIRLLSEDGNDGLTYLAKFKDTVDGRRLKIEVKKPHDGLFDDDQPIRDRVVHARRDVA